MYIAFPFEGKVMSSKLGCGAQRKGKFCGWEVKKKGTLVRWAWGYRMAARSGLSLGPIYLTPATTHRKQEMTSRFLSFSSFLAAINASARTCNFERLLRPIRWPVMSRQFVRNPTTPSFPAYLMLFAWHSIGDILFAKILCETM